jgi:RHS repeat-associated protein
VLSIDTTTLTYDALGRNVEQNRGGYYQVVYAPSGQKLAIMQGQTLQQAFVPLPGGGTAEYLSWGLSHYRHSDWLGGNRLGVGTGHNIVHSTGYAPFGEPDGQTGNGELSFTGQNKDTVWLQYDFMFRQYDPKQGRWISPDPAGLGAVNMSDPQTWNRYTYVGNHPLQSVDPLGLLRDDCIGCNLSVAGQTSFGTTYYVNGMRVPERVALGLMSMGAAVSCPACRPGDVVGNDNQIYRWRPTTYGRDCTGTLGGQTVCGPMYLKYRAGWRASGLLPNGDLMLSPSAQAYGAAISSKTRLITPPEPDYMSISVPFGNVTFADGKVYTGPQLGTPGSSPLSLTAGWLDDRNVSLDDFARGTTVSGCAFVGIGGCKTWSPGAGTAWEFGFGLPGAGISGGHSSMLNTHPSTWGQEPVLIP